LPRLFDPMTAGDRQRDKSQGLGLGLFITEQIVQGHGGSIHVESTHAGGTRFSVSLPRVAGARE
jgi:signal transduction histidine kinase